MERTVYHVMPHKRGGWQVRKEYARNAKKRCPTKAEAIVHAKALAKARIPSQIKIHTQNGRIQKEFTYGDDPRRYKG